MALKTVQFLALVLTALALVPAGAHLFTLLNKMDLAQEHLSWLGAVRHRLDRRLAGEFRSGGDVARPRPPVHPGADRRSLRRGDVRIFFIWTYPANQATDNWTTIPADWEQLRRQWEYSHAVNALVTFAAFCSVALSVLTMRD